MPEAPPGGEHRAAFRRRKRWLVGVWLGSLPAWLAAFAAGRLVLGLEFAGAGLLALGAWAAVTAWWRFGLLRCPACGGMLPTGGMFGVWFHGARLVHDCGALLQDPGAPPPVVGGAGPARWAGLLSFVLGVGAWGAAQTLQGLGVPHPRPLFLLLGAAGLILMAAGAAVHARARGLSLLWGALVLAGPLGIPVLLLMGGPCPGCGRPRSWRWSRCRWCGAATPPPSPPRPPPPPSSAPR